MQIHIDTDDELERERIIRLLLYTLNARRADIDSMRLSLAPVRDALGVKLNRCVVQTALRDGQTLQVEETQSSSELAVTRALERCARTVQRRLSGPEARRIV
jgi:hypothetical protein